VTNHCANSYGQLESIRFEFTPVQREEVGHVGRCRDRASFIGYSSG
jgi:hypothetical protein